MSTGLIDPHYVTGTLSYVWPYLKVTLSLTAIAVFFGSLIGIFGAIGEIMGGRLTRKLIRAYVLVCRSLPNLVLLYLVYYGLPIFYFWLFTRNGGFTCLMSTYLPIWSRLWDLHFTPVPTSRKSFALRSTP